MGFLKSLYLEIRGLEADTNYSYPFRREILEEIANQILKTCRATTPLPLIGHRLGDYKNYPKDANSHDLIPKYSSTTELMERAFLSTGLDGIELDIQGDSEDEIYVTHDPLIEPIEDISKEYLKLNTFGNFINHFISHKYYLNKKIYIEIKQQVPIFSWRKFTFIPDSMEFVNTHFLKNVIKTIDRYTSKNPERLKICSAINFISFHLSPLEYLREISSELHSTFYIITTNQSPQKYLAPLARHRALFPSEMERIRRADFLTGIWFDPFYLENPQKTLDSLNIGREKKLEFYLSTYGMPVNDIIEKLRKDSEKLELHGLIFELG